MLPETEKVWEVFVISYSANRKKCQAVIHVRKYEGGKRSYTRHLEFDPITKLWRGNGYGKRSNKKNNYALAGEIREGKIRRFSEPIEMENAA